MNPFAVCLTSYVSKREFKREFLDVILVFSNPMLLFPPVDFPLASFVLLLDALKMHLPRCFSVKEEKNDH